jgi:hypothetical protein
MYSGLENLTKELQTAAANKILLKDRRQLALDLLDQISLMSVLGYMFENDDYFPDVHPTVLRDVKIYVGVNARWHVSPTFYNNIKSSSSSAPITVCESAPPDFEEEFD